MDDKQHFQLDSKWKSFSVRNAPQKDYLYWKCDFITEIFSMFFLCGNTDCSSSFRSYFFPHVNVIYVIGKSDNQLSVEIHFKPEIRDQIQLHLLSLNDYNIIYYSLTELTLNFLLPSVRFFFIQIFWRIEWMWTKFKHCTKISFSFSPIKPLSVLCDKDLDSCLWMSAYT